MELELFQAILQRPCFKRALILSCSVLVDDGHSHSQPTETWRRIGYVAWHLCSATGIKFSGQLERSKRVYK